MSSEPRSNSRSTADSFRSGVLGGIVSSKRKPTSLTSGRRTVSWMCDSPVSTDTMGGIQDDAPTSLMSRGSLPRCAVVNFCREGDIVRWTPRARENTGGMAARVKDFDDAFQLEELSSRTFGLSQNFRRRRRQHQSVFDDENRFDLSTALVAAAEAGLEAPAPTPAPRKRRMAGWRRFAGVFAARKGKQANNMDERADERHVIHQRTSVSMGNLTMVRDTTDIVATPTLPSPEKLHPVEKKQTFRRPRMFRRRAAARNDLALFDPDSVLVTAKMPRRRWRWRRARNTNSSSAGRPLQPDRRRAQPDPYIEFMDDEF